MMKKIIPLLLMAIISLSSMSVFSFPVKSVPQITQLLNAGDEAIQADLQNVLDLRNAYSSLLRSIQSYDCSYGTFEYYSTEVASENGQRYGVSPEYFLQLPVSRLYHAKRYGGRCYEFSENNNTFFKYIENDKSVTDFCNSEKHWVVTENQKVVGLTDKKLRKGKVITNFLGLVNEKPEDDASKPFGWEADKPWDIANQVSFESALTSVLANEGVITDISQEEYHAKPAIHIRMDFPKFDGANYFILSLDERDYGQPLFIYQKSGCNHCADLTKRTVVWETIIDNMEYDYVLAKDKTLVPVLKSCEVVYYKNKKTAEIYNTVLFDCKFDSIEKTEDLVIPFPENQKLSFPKIGDVAFGELEQKLPGFSTFLYPVKEKDAFIGKCDWGGFSQETIEKARVCLNKLNSAEAVAGLLKKNDQVAYNNLLKKPYMPLLVLGITLLSAGRLFRQGLRKHKREN